MSQLQESTEIMSEWGEYNVQTFELYCKEKNEDTSVIYSPTKCEDCGQAGEEWYRLEFVGHNVITEDGEIIEL
jgi:hypothetical protein